MENGAKAVIMVGGEGSRPPTVDHLQSHANLRGGFKPHRLPDPHQPRPVSDNIPDTAGSFLLLRLSYNAQGPGSHIAGPRVPERKEKNNVREVLKTKE